MTNCESVRDSLGAWLDGELKPADAHSLQLHVEQCAACARERQQLDQLEAVLKRVIRSGAPDIAFEPFWNGVQKRIEERTEERTRWHSGLSDWAQAVFAVPRLAWAVPVVIGLLLGLLSLDSLVPVWKKDAQRENFASVESIDSYGRNVALFRDNEAKTTVIWLYQNQEGEDESSRETTEPSPSF
jgi:anti-sigma factor RsiW